MVLDVLGRTVHRERGDNTECGASDGGVAKKKLSKQRTYLTSSAEVH